MKPNVSITARERGKLVRFWEGHNTWTQHGREHLARLISLSSYIPDTPVTGSRVKHLQFGIGGNLQSGDTSAIDASYPAGFDPNATSGNTYDHTYPIAPPISTLERPVRISGGDDPYASADPADVWLTPTTPPKFLSTAPTPTQRRLRFLISGIAGDIVYAPFTAIPLAEAGLVLSGDANVNAPYNLVVAYINFDTLQVTPTIEIEIRWDITF